MKERMLWSMVLVAMFTLPGYSNTNTEKQFLTEAKAGAQQRNAKLLTGYDYSKYISALRSAANIRPSLSLTLATSPKPV